jgi:YD repeat-containing protein
MNRKFGLVVFLSIYASCVALMAQTSTNWRYIHDEAGQLIGVIDENNNATAYRYDEVGNLLAIERLSVRGVVDIFFVEPNSGKAAVPPQLPGTAVTLHGLGFSAVPAENQVTFNGVTAVVDAATTTMIKTSVPAGARTGPVRVTSPLGTAISRSDFIVSNIFISLSPTSVQVATRLTQQFTATLTEFGSVISGSVVWSVNRIVGGNPTVGTIDRNGLYTAPATLPQPPTVTVTATSAEEPTAVANATVNLVLSLGPMLGSISYRIAPGPPTTTPLFTAGVSYRIGRPEDATPLASIFTRGVSYRIGRPEDRTPLAAIFTRGVSYHIAGPPGGPALAPIFNRGISYTTIVITGLSPNPVSRGATDVSFTVTGSNLRGATTLDFLLPGGARDNNVTVAGLTINPDGTQITGRLSVAGAASAGSRTVVVRTPLGGSSTAATASNQLVIQ